MLNKLFHSIVDALPIHEGQKADLHRQVDDTVEKPEEDNAGSGE
jgi:hypothetical protein